MNWGVGLLAIFCSAMIGGLIVSNNQSHQEPVKEEVSMTQNPVYVGEIGPCKAYISKQTPGTYGHATFTTVCPKEYTVSTTTLY